jgi:hypothetical protein
VAQVCKQGLRACDAEDEAPQGHPRRLPVADEVVQAVPGVDARKHGRVVLGDVVHVDHEIGDEPQNDDGREAQPDAARAQVLAHEEDNEDGARDGDHRICSKGREGARKSVGGLNRPAPELHYRKFVEPAYITLFNRTSPTDCVFALRNHVDTVTESDACAFKPAFCGGYPWTRARMRG